MPVTEGSLKTRIEAAIISEFGTPNDAAANSKFASAVAKAVVDELRASGTVTVTSVSAVTPGAGVSGGGTGKLDVT